MTVIVPIEFVENRNNQIKHLRAYLMSKRDMGLINKIGAEVTMETGLVHVLHVYLVGCKMWHKVFLPEVRRLYPLRDDQITCHGPVINNKYQQVVLQLFSQKESEEYEDCVYACKLVTP